MTKFERYLDAVIEEGIQSLSTAELKRRDDLLQQYNDSKRGKIDKKTGKRIPGLTSAERDELEDLQNQYKG